MDALQVQHNRAHNTQIWARNRKRERICLYSGPKISLQYLKILNYHGNDSIRYLIPKGWRPFFGLFWNFGQAIVDAMFVQKISNFWCSTYGLVLASRCTNFYKIPIFSLGAMPQKQNYFEVQAARAAKNFLFLKIFELDFLNISST